MSRKEYSIVDAFLDLSSISDDEVVDMIKPKKINEGKEFSILASHDELEQAREFLNQKSVDEDSIEVMDVDADTLDHLKKKTDYVGQMMLKCNKCHANRFIDASELIPDAEDPDLYNTETECMNCRSAGSGYSIIGQVVKTEVSEVKPAEPTDDTEEIEDKNNNRPFTPSTNKSKVSDNDLPVAEPTIANDEAPTEATFDNDIEPEEPVVDINEPAAEEQNKPLEADEAKPDEDKEEEKEDLETNTSEDDDIFKTPKLGDEIKESFTEDFDDVSDAFTNAVELREELSDNARNAWMMNEVISAMNDEEAYYGGWLYIWPDGEDEEQCEYDFSDDESFEELKDAFIDTYQEYHAEGLYTSNKKIIDYAHKMDIELGLPQIKVIMAEAVEEVEDAEESVDNNSPVTIADLLDLISNYDEIKTINVVQCSKDSCENTYSGTADEMDEEILLSEFTSFNVGEEPLTLVVDCETEDNSVGTVLSYFKSLGEVLLTTENLDEVFTGGVEDAIDQFGNCKFIAIEKPVYLEIVIGEKPQNNNRPLATDDELIEAIIKENHLAAYRMDDPRTAEYWIAESIYSGDGLDVIYDKYVKNHNKSLVEAYKKITGYKTELDEMLDKYGVELLDKWAKEAATNYIDKVVAENLELDESIINEDLNVDYSRLLEYAIDLNYDDLNAEIYTDEEKGIVNNWIYLCDPTEDDVAEYLNKSIDEITQEDIDDIDEDAFVQFLKDHYRDAAIDDAITHASDDDIEYEDLVAEPDYDEYDAARDDMMTESLLGVTIYVVDKYLAQYIINAGITDVDELEVEEFIDYLDENGLYDVGTEKQGLYSSAVEALKYNVNHKVFTLDEFIADETMPAPKSYYPTDENFSSYKTRSELAEAIKDARKNNRPFTVRRSIKEGYRYDLLEANELDTIDAIDGEVIDRPKATTTAVEPALDETSRRILNKISDISQDIVNAMQETYNIEVDPALVVADILQDLRLISGQIRKEDLDNSPLNQLTAQMYDDYEQFYEFVDILMTEITGETFITTPEQKLEQAIQALYSPAFSTEAIYQGIASDRFLETARRGLIPYVDRLQLTQRNEGFDAEQFENDINEYFDKEYNESLIYSLQSVNRKGNKIFVEGYVQGDEVGSTVTFTLTKKLNEAYDLGKYETVTDKGASATDTVYTVTNNLSDEVFEFINNTPDAKIFDEYNKDAETYLNEFKTITKIKNVTPDMLGAVAECALENHPELKKLGHDASTIKNKLYIALYK